MPVLSIELQLWYLVFLKMTIFSTMSSNVSSTETNIASTDLQPGASVKYTNLMNLGLEKDEEEEKKKEMEEKKKKEQMKPKEEKIKPNWKKHCEKDQEWCVEFIAKLSKSQRKELGLPTLSPKVINSIKESCKSVKGDMNQMICFKKKEAIKIMQKYANNMKTQMIIMIAVGIGLFLLFLVIINIIVCCCCFCCCDNESSGSRGRGRTSRSRRRSRRSRRYSKRSKSGRSRSRRSSRRSRSRR